MGIIQIPKSHILGSGGQKCLAPLRQGTGEVRKVLGPLGGGQKVLLCQKQNKKHNQRAKQEQKSMGPLELPSIYAWLVFDPKGPALF